MKEENISKVIKDLRKKVGLTQNEFAQKYNVSPQAVSKWEMGLNAPDILILKKIAKDFNITIEGLLEGKIEINKKKNNKLLIIIIILILILGIIIFLLFKRSSNFEFKTLNTTCDNFKISGSISYNDKKSAIYISEVEYCGKKDNEKYKKIDCTLYEAKDDIKKVIGNCDNKGKDILLEDYLKDVSFKIDNYLQICKKYDDDSLFLEINAINKDDKTITYKIPLALEKCR